MAAPAHGADPFFSVAIPGTEFAIPVHHYVVTSWLIMLVLFLASYMATKKMDKVPKGIQNFMEFVVDGLLGFFSGVMGEGRAKKYGPFIMTLFLYILLANYSGLIPGAAHLPGLMPPTANISVTAALAILVFLSIFFYGIRAKGLGFFKHFFQPMAFLFILNVVEEMVRPVSLSLRLYGNIYGEEQIIAKLGDMVPFLVPLPMMLLSILLGAIQAFVFALLASTYIAGATDDHH